MKPKSGWLVLGSRNGKSFPISVHTNKDGLQKAIDEAKQLQRKNRDVVYCAMSVVVK